jgi:hypothetical protein
MKSYWQIFRLIFVIFSLYLLGDAFYRWDGFRYHSSFSEFLPSVALAAILWSILSIMLSLIIWLVIKPIARLLQTRKTKITSEHIFLFVTFSTICGILVWVAKRFIFDLAGSTTLFKFLVIISLFFTSVFLTWLLRNKFNVIQEKITPLVWLFGSFVIISLPLVAYNTWWRKADDTAPQKIYKHLSAHSDRPNIILIKTPRPLAAGSLHLFQKNKTNLTNETN